MIASGFQRKRRMSAWANVVFPAPSCPIRKILSHGTRSKRTSGNVSSVIFMGNSAYSVTDIFRVLLLVFYREQSSCFLLY